MPGLVALRAGAVVTVAAFEVRDGRVSRIWVVRNPEKLRCWVQKDPPPVPPARRPAQSPPA
jgi:RNA polymerase sigma-70 factor (ECF subfamily)